MRNERLPSCLQFFLIFGFMLIIVHSVERIPVDLDNMKVVLGILEGRLSKEKVNELNVVEIPPIDGGISGYVVSCNFDKFNKQGKFDMERLVNLISQRKNSYIVFFGTPPSLSPTNLSKIMDEYNITVGITEFDESTDYMFNVVRMRKKKSEFFRVHRIKEKEYMKLKLDLTSTLRRWKRAVFERSVDLLYITPPPENWSVSYTDYVGKIRNELRTFITRKITIPSKDFKAVYSIPIALITCFMLFFTHSIFILIPYIVLVILSFFWHGSYTSELLALYIGAVGPVSLYHIIRRKLEGYIQKFMPISLFFFGFGALTLGYAVNSVLSDFYHITQLYTYRGVKISIILLPSLVFIREFFDERHGFFSEKIRIDYTDFIVLSIISFAGVYYVLRSGNYSLVLNTERKFRDMVETILLVRPRFKEIIGYTFLFLMREYDETDLFGKYHFILPVLGSIGIVGTVNTFCHIKAPLFISLYRSFLGIIIGYFFGYILSKLIKNPRGFKPRG